MPKRKKSSASTNNYYNRRKKVKLQRNANAERTRQTSAGLSSMEIGKQKDNDLPLHAHHFHDRIMVHWRSCDCCDMVVKESLLEYNNQGTHEFLPPEALLCSPCTKFQKSDKEQSCGRNKRFNQLDTGKSTKSSILTFQKINQFLPCVKFKTYACVVPANTKYQHGANLKVKYE